MPDGVENSSLQTATIEGTREDSLAEAAINERTELEEEKNESEIMNVNFGMFCRQQLSHRSKTRLFAILKKYIREKAVFTIKYRICFLFLSRGIITYLSIRNKRIYIK